MSLSFLLLLTFLLYTPSLSTPQQLHLSSFSISDSPWSPDKNQILVSLNSTFAAGFRPVPSSPALYTFDIWYLNISDNTTVWSVNEKSPVNRSSSLFITPSGTLFLNGFAGKNLWLPSAVGKPNTTRLVLGDDGNLVFGNWMSFSYPTDTILPNQIMNGTRLVSKNGKFMFRNSKDLILFPSEVYWFNHDAIRMLNSSGMLVTENGNSLEATDFGATHLRRLKLDDDGNLRIYSLDPGSDTWTVVWEAVLGLCTIPGKCGPDYICMSNKSTSTYCVCPPGFRRVRSAGSGEEVCERKIPLTSGEGSKFLRLDYVNFSTGSNQTDLKAPNFKSCESRCLANPKCLGFAIKFDGQRFCIHHLDRLINGYWSPGPRVMFLRVSESETDVSNFTGMTSMLDTSCPVRISLPLPPKNSKTETRNLAIICTLFSLELVIGVISFWAFIKTYIRYHMAWTLGLEFLPSGGPKRFTYAELKAATNDFSNIVGQGGFGTVYKGELQDRRVVAVKRLKDVSGGEAEFWAEVTIIARMHHLNLVRLWGFCAEKGKRMLVYEFIPNGSLDKFLFPSELDESRPILDWSIRYRIAIGVARAIAYLHEECLEWVLHRDIKPENILIGDDFCPKVSDFGLAKQMKKEEKVSISRVQGTRGYMAPEWLKAEPVTAKADVYSFGMVLLELVTGTRNSEFRRTTVGSEEWYLPMWAFEKVYKEMTVDELLDGRIKGCYESEIHFDMVDRMVKTAMWCLQDQAEKRPSMGKVAKMLEGTVEITEPGMPVFCYGGMSSWSKTSRGMFSIGSSESPAVALLSGCA
ncbi:hypothetical protein HHK36_031857 [Tetracentron sinense]|uniref:Receptor-like serine/threonine-protein kinase n=1 Tax=Tetracentron sinense TaxID=13715 RepID=A0A835CXN9_TETSI|nr:hypothetical protein HHK36_031857 [Tetracentron sinense]